MGDIVWQRWIAGRRAWRWVVSSDQRRVLTLTLLPIAGFLLAGMTEPIWENGEKLNHAFWLFCGVNFATSVRALAAAREHDDNAREAPTVDGAEANSF